MKLPDAPPSKGKLSNIDEATAIITNPTHFAVALKYEVGSPSAPVVITMGRGVMAQQIISRGEEFSDNFPVALLSCAVFHQRYWSGNLRPAV